MHRMRREVWLCDRFCVCLCLFCFVVVVFVACVCVCVVVVVAVAVVVVGGGNCCCIFKISITRRMGSHTPPSEAGFLFIFFKGACSVL